MRAGVRSGPRADRITWVGHACVLLELSGARLLTDPLARRRLWHLVRVAPPVDREALEGLDAVLVSHLHQDHFDLPSLRGLPRRGVTLVVPRGAGRLASRLGFSEVNELAVGDRLRIGATDVTAVPAVHDDARGPFGPRADPLGFVMSAQARVYFAGDTDRFDGMADLAEGLDAALLPVWGWGPTIGDGHLDPAGAASCLELLRPRIAVPIHWGTYFPLGLSRLLPARLSEPPLEFERHAARVAPAVDVRVLAPGEATPLT